MPPAVEAAIAAVHAAAWGRPQVEALRHLACEADAAADELLEEVRAAEAVAEAEIADQQRHASATHWRT